VQDSKLSLRDLSAAVMLGAVHPLFLAGLGFSALGQSTFSLNDMLVPQKTPAPSPAAETGLGMMAGETSDPLASILGNTANVSMPLQQSASDEVVVSDGRRRRSFASEMKQVDWALASDHIVDGLITSFFQKASLAPEERKCLDSQAGEFVGDVAGIVTDIVKALKPIFSKKSKNSDIASSFSTASVGPLLMDGVVRITGLVGTTTNLAKDCLKGDGLLVLNQTAKNLQNFTYIENRFVVNGIDIAEALAEAVVSFEEERFSKFGQEIGLALRQVLLSTNNKGTITLPEGFATDDIVAKCTEGMTAGFFARGSEMIITDVADADVNIEIDLKHCIVQNHEMYHDIFKSIWILIAQLSVNKGQHQFGSGSSGGSPMWVQELVLALARIPMALQRCDVLGAETEQMFEEALRTLGSIRFNFELPDDKIQADKATEKVAVAVERFAQHDFYGFGKELGVLFRELLLLVLPQKYSVDTSGRLQRNLVGKAVALKNRLEEQQSKFGAPMFVVGGLAFVLLLAMTAFKSFRVVASWRQGGSTFTDVEVGDHEEHPESLE